MTWKRGLSRMGSHPGDFDRGDGYVPSPNQARERIRRARDAHARRHMRTRERLERDIERRIRAA